MKENMKMIMRIIKLSAILVFAFSLSGFSQQISKDWPQFRGQNRDGISLEIISPLDWNQSPPELIWKTEIGSAFSEIVISKDVIYTMFSEKIDSISGFEYVAAFEKSTGKEIWRSQVDSIFIDVDGWGDGPRSTPTIDEDNIYSFSGNGKLTANSRKNGKIIWQIDFIKDYGSRTPRWGYASSPLLVDGKLIMEVGGTDSGAFMAFNPANGEKIWASEKGNASHDSPLLVNIEGQEQIIFLNGRKMYSLKFDGDTLWTYKMPFRNITAMPVFIAPNKIFVSGVRNPGFFIAEIENNQPKEFLKGSSMKNDYNSCIYYKEKIYGFHVAALRCISAKTGEVVWNKRGFGKGSLIMVDGNLFVLSDKGKLVLVETETDNYVEKGSVQALNGKSWTAPSFADGKIFVRNLTEIACFKVK
jgi:outer membrane protein assembly factor BamB